MRAHLLVHPLRRALASVRVDDIVAHFEAGFALRLHRCGPEGTGIRVFREGRGKGAAKKGAPAFPESSDLSHRGRQDAAGIRCISVLLLDHRD